MLEESQSSVKCQQLLRELKGTVEGLLVSQVPNVWSIFGGLNRLHSAVEKIFKHACTGCSEEGISSYWNFIQGLEWLQPETTKSHLYIDCTYKPPIPFHMKNDKAAIWLYRSLETHCLSQQLSWLLTDKTHLNTCYQQHAFLRQQNYTDALQLCLRAVERNQASLLSEINPSLFLNKVSAGEFHKIHRRCSSFPDSHLKMVLSESRPMKRDVVDGKAIEMDLGMEAEGLDRKTKKSTLYGKIKPWSSMPCLYSNDSVLRKRNKPQQECKTTPTTPVHTRAKFSPWEKRKSLPRKGILKKTSKVKHVIIDNCDIVEHTAPLSSSQSSGTCVNEESVAGGRGGGGGGRSPMRKIMPEYARPGQKDYKRYPRRSFMEDGGMRVQPVATGYFPRPQEGQTLLSFLTSSQFSRANAELDRENAHFNISEAMISAMEQIRCKRDMTLTDDQAEDSDPEIVDLKQRIRLRRRQKLVEIQRKMWTASSLMSDGKTDTTTSVSPGSTTPDTISDSESTEDVDDLEVDEVSNLVDNNGLSMSMASLYSDADLFKKPREAPDGASDILSAESVALSLISKFNEKQLPRASELEWLVSEKDAPQALLPLPKSWPVSPDDPDEIPETPLRGTKEWAPPRPQIIFTLHPSPNQKVIMAKQNFRCAGCSMKVAPKYASRFRYCDYLGRYFCTFCHTNQVALIPARILQKWDFTRYPVSNFSYRLLEQMYADPLFPIFELNQNIGKRSKNLLFCRKYRLGLYYMKDFIFSCRYAENIQEVLQKELPSISQDPEVYSIEQLVLIRNGEMKSKLKYLVELCCRHTSECQLCVARGFICEICHKEEPIFPWQMRTVTRCSKCGSCYHSSCWNTQAPCIKCARRDKRRESSD